MDVRREQEILSTVVICPPTHQVFVNRLEIEILTDD